MTTAEATLASTIQELYKRSELGAAREAAREAFKALRSALNRGEVRAAERRGDAWVVNAWVKQGILLGFRVGELVEMSKPAAPLHFFDKDTLPTHPWSLEDRVRIVPGGSSIRDGCHLAPGVICMPPMYVNIGAYVDEGSMIDSHVLVGSCAQIGKRVHLSAAAQVGGVLEPVNSAPVIIEDDVLLGGNTGVYEGTHVAAGAIIAAGTILTRSTPVYDLVRETIYRAEGDQPLRIPPAAVVVPGSRSVTRGRGPQWGLSLYAPVIVKYRDDKTEKSIELEDWLR